MIIKNTVTSWPCLREQGTVQLLSCGHLVLAYASVEGLTYASSK